jgi:Fur family peroxide stress response transcriptional regulator
VKLAQEELKQRMSRFKEELRRSGMKLTHQRLEVFREVAISGDHPSVETIFRGVRARVPTVSLDTVYRTLWMLLDLGLITTLGPPRERARFDANMTSHHHFICSRCGKTLDFYSDEFDQLEVPESVKALGRAEKTQVEIRGVCLRCSKEGKAQRKTNLKER